MVSCVRIYLLLIPYDGNGIGVFLGDAGREATGTLGRVISTGSTGPFQESSHQLNLGYLAEVGTVVLDFALSRVWPTSHEFRGASISACFLITY